MDLIFSISKYFKSYNVIWDVLVPWLKNWVHFWSDLRFLFQSLWKHFWWIICPEWKIKLKEWMISFLFRSIGLLFAVSPLKEHFWLLFILEVLSITRFIVHYFNFISAFNGVTNWNHGIRFVSLDVVFLQRTSLHKERMSNSKYFLRTKPNRWL